MDQANCPFVARATDILFFLGDFGVDYEKYYYLKDNIRYRFLIWKNLSC